MTTKIDPIKYNLDFSNLKEIRLPATSPDGQKLVLCEASGAAGAAYNSARAACIKFNRTGAQAGMQGVGSLESLLVSKCLFYADNEGNPIKNTNGTLRSVPQDVIESWPYGVQKKIYDTIREISPHLKEQEQTPDTIRKQMADLQKELDLLEGNSEDSAKN